jgi:hypothetical protein
MNTTKILFSFLLLFYISNSTSQELTYTSKNGMKTVTKLRLETFFDQYGELVSQELKKYQGNGIYDADHWAVHDELLTKQLKDIFNQLIFGKSDLVSAASAVGLTVNEDKTAVSTNFNLPIAKSKGGMPEFINIGLNATGQGKIFNFYNDETWQNKVGASVGFVWKLSKATRYYNLTKFQKEDLKRRRQYHMKLMYFNELDKQRFSIENYKLIEEIIQIYDNGKINSLKQTESHSKLLARYPEYKKLFSKTDFLASYDFLNKEQNVIKAFFDRVDDKKAIDKFIKEKLIEFDKNNVVLYGYNNMWWVDTNIAFNNNGFNFTEDNISVMNLEAFRENILGITLKGDLNWSRETKNNIFYVNGGLSYDKGSFMNSSLINGTPKIIENTSSQVIIVDDSGRILGTVDDLKSNFSTGSFYTYFAWFGTKNKNIGFNASFSHQYLIDSSEITEFSNNFTLIGGPLAKTKDGSTFGIDVGFSNAVYDTRIVNDFVVRLRVGIPFNIVSNKKKK